MLFELTEWCSIRWNLEPVIHTYLVLVLPLDPQSAQICVLLIMMPCRCQVTWVKWKVAIIKYRC